MIDRLEISPLIVQVRHHAAVAGEEVKTISAGKMIGAGVTYENIAASPGGEDIIAT